MLASDRPKTGLTRLPVALSAFALAAAMVMPIRAQEGGTAVAEPAVDLPSAEAVYEKYLDAMGGREALNRVSSSLHKGNLEAGPMVAPIVIKRQRPGNIAVSIELPQFGTMMQGSNGEVAWDVSPMTGTRLLEGEEKAEMLRKADFEEELNPQKYYELMNVLGKEDVNDKPAYVVEFTTKSGKTEKRFFDEATGLVVKTETKQKAPMVGELIVSQFPSDYREVDGVKVPFQTEIKNKMQSSVLKFDEVQFNVEHEAGSFDPPEEVTKLMEEKQG